VNPWLAIGSAAALAAAGRGLGWLTTDGAAAATVVGSVVFWGAGLAGALLLALFFASGSILTSLNQRRGAARTARQVLTNGGWAAAGAAAVPWRPDVGWALLMGSLATAQADTWATEVGAHAAHPPKLITTGNPVPPGTSGGITSLGTGAGVLGAILLALLGFALGVPLRAAALAAFAGMLGMMVDSVLGATLEAGSWLNNDGVNLGATTFGAFTAVTLVLAFHR
jgi:uncharacterized protein (TIGR00297 family)